MRDDLAIIKYLETLHNRIDDMDDNSYDNTVIQFFEAPHDNTTLTALMQAIVNGATINASPTDTTTLTAQVTPTVAYPGTFTYGGYDANGKLWNAGWYWGYGGAWSDGPKYTLTLLPVIYSS